MTSQDKLDLAITNAKTKAMDLAYKYINLSKNGEEIGCKDLKLVVMTAKISAMEDFYCQNFDENGNIIPTFTCVPETLVKQFTILNFPPAPGQFEINVIDGNA